MGRVKVGQLRKEDGATSVEYAILGSLIAAVIVGVVTTLGGRVLNLFDAIRWW